MTTTVDLIAGVGRAARATGIDITDPQVGFIVGTFLEGVVHTLPSTAADPILQAVADQCNALAADVDVPRGG